MLKRLTIVLSFASLLTYGCASNASQTPKSQASQSQTAPSESTATQSSSTQSVAQVDDQTGATKAAASSKDSFGLAVGMPYAKARQQLLDQVGCRMYREMHPIGKPHESTPFLHMAMKKLNPALELGLRLVDLNLSIAPGKS
jgi:hypothetical protein